MLYGQLASAQSSLDALADAEEARLDAQRDATREARRRKAEERERRRQEAERREDERMDRIRESADKASERRAELFEGIAGRSDTRAGLRALALRGAKGIKDDEKTLTAEEFAKKLREELNRLMRDLNSLREFGSNFFPESGDMGRVATHASAQTDILMEQNRQLGKLVRGQWHPGAWNVGNELAVAGTTVGF